MYPTGDGEHPQTKRPPKPRKSKNKDKNSKPKSKSQNRAPSEESESDTPESEESTTPHDLSATHGTVPLPEGSESDVPNMPVSSASDGGDPDGREGSHPLMRHHNVVGLQLTDALDKNNTGGQGGLQVADPIVHSKGHQDYTARRMGDDVLTISLYPVVARSSSSTIPGKRIQDGEGQHLPYKKHHSLAPSLGAFI